MYKLSQSSQTQNAERKSKYAQKVTVQGLAALNPCTSDNKKQLDKELSFHRSTSTVILD